MSTTVSVSREVAASAEVVWALLSDLPRMGEWSPENGGGRWVKGATGPAVGARFKGDNANGSHTWSTDAVVTACDPGRVFSFHVTAAGLAIADWHYEVEPSGPDRCIVTETWTDRRGRVARLFGGKASGVSDRASYTRTSMATTLAGVAATAEADQD